MHSYLTMLRKAIEKCGIACSIMGLAAWTLAILAAVAQPLLDLQVPSSWVVVLVTTSGLFTLLAVPQLLSQPPTAPQHGHT